MWWNKREEDGPEGGGGGAVMSGSEDERAQQQQQHRTSSVPSKKSRVGGTNRQTFLGSKSLTARRGNRKKNKNSQGPPGDNSSSNTNSASGHRQTSSSQGKRTSSSKSQARRKNPDAPGASADGSGNSGDVAETHMGFEVSLMGHLLPEEQTPTNDAVLKSPTGKSRGQLKPVISFQSEVLTRQKITRTQYSVSQWPALGPKPGQLGGSSAKVPIGLPNNKNHRVVLQPEKSRASNQHKSSSSELSAFEDALFLLRSHEVVDEMTSLKEELKHLNGEIDALYADKEKLEKMPLNSNEVAVPPVAAAAAVSDTSNLPTTWDANELLASKTPGNAQSQNPATTATSTSDSPTDASSTSITAEQRLQLQNARGTTLTVFFHDKTATEAFAAKCGIKHHVMTRFKDSSKNSVLELSMDTCKEGGAATHVSQLSLLCKGGGRGGAAGSELGFFIGRDQGKSMYWGHLPDRLYRRMQDSGMNPKQSTSELVYLAVGPMDYYYAEFRSGEAWWGSAIEDRAFQTICNEWDVYRVAFGPTLVMDDFDGDLHSQTLPWIIVSRDGRAAWKNLPSRLDHLLSRRMANQAGIAEVSLGSGDAYFCRFLDGTTDYCLPAQQAQIAQDLEARGLTITSIVLHPELSHDFVIRSTYH